VSLSNSGGGTWIMGTGGSALVVGQTSTINFDTLKTVDHAYIKVGCNDGEKMDGLLEYSNGSNWIRINSFSNAGCGFDLPFSPVTTTSIKLTMMGGGGSDHQISWFGYGSDGWKVYAYTPEPVVTIPPPKSSTLTITKSASPYSLRQFQESTIKVLIENSGTSEVKAIEIMDSIHPSFDLTGGDFPNPKKFDSIRAAESREIQYTIRSKESGVFTLDPATVTYADSEGNIQEVRSEPVSIKVVPSSDGGSSGTNTGQNSKSASFSLHGEKTDVVMGEDILLRLSAVNLITKPKMRVQVIIIPPSGMSVTSSEFSKSAAGQFTANYQLEPGDGKDIEVRIRSNQVGDFNVNGRIIYYFGDDKEKAEDQTLNLPIKVRKEIGSDTAQAQTSAQKSTPGFELFIAISGLFLLAKFL
jgi:hypothetical protein